MKRLLATMVCAIVLALGGISCSGSKTHFIVTNSGSEIINKAVIRLDDQMIEFRDIEPSGSASGRFSITRDGHYEIAVWFQSGGELHQNLGYVTKGFNFHHEIVVTDTGIELAKTSLD